ncbi:Myo5 [Bugula neritina]|uniref:Myo5 n=1 Tax=Bugula neritina TaxID=10212 RepID=A0A7J7JQB7_BUGNE|nr:Myo5 [Bugula neritina]
MACVIFIDQFTALNEELSRRREECIQLKSLLASRTKDSIETAKESYGGNAEILNEDGELASAYQTLKDVNRVLQRDLELEKSGYKRKELELRATIEELKKDNNRQQDLIGQLNKVASNLSMSPEQAMQNALQFEIQRLMSENLDMREKCDQLEDKVRKLKKAVKIYSNRLKEHGVSGNSEGVSSKGKPEEGLEEDEEEEMGGKIKYQPTKNYMGMLEYKKEEEAALVKHLVTDLKPRVAITLIPTLPAYILFMCLRHTDHLNEDSRCKTLLTNVINGIKKVSKAHQDDIETLILWLSNTCRFLHLLKQYSGEKSFQVENTELQNNHCLRNFDLSEYRAILNDLAVWLYQGVVKTAKEHIHPLIVGALLEYEGIQGLSSKPSMSRQRSSSHSDTLEAPSTPEHCFENLIKTLSSWVNLMRTHGFDTLVVNQLFKQLFYFIVATAANNLLLRKDMCNWSKGMQIRYNLSNLEQWLRDNRLHECGAVEAMEPLIQASQLLQARKTAEDVDSICEMCSQLSVAQIIKILNLYTPVDEYEERVPISFIRKIQQTLKEKRKSDSSNPQALLIDTKQFFPVMFPFCPSSIGLESIDIPSVLKLGFLVRL